MSVPERGPRILTRGETDAEAAIPTRDRINEAIAHAHTITSPRAVPSTTINATEAEAWAAIRSATVGHFDLAGRSSGWDELEAPENPERVSASTRATGPTTTTARAIRKLLELRRRDERVARMSPERRALYHRILSRREQIGPVDLDVAKALKELRGDG